MQTSSPPTTKSLYEADFYAWTIEQAELLKNQQWQALDLVNLIEEIESLGRQQRQELRNQLAVLLGHLLKWQYQPQHRSRSWLSTMRMQRRELLELIKDNPSLKPYLAEALEIAYLNGRDLAIAETNLPESTFPPNCNYSLTETLDEAFFQAIGMNCFNSGRTGLFADPTIWYGRVLAIADRDERRLIG